MAPKMTALLSALLLAAAAVDAQASTMRVDLDTPCEHAHPHITRLTAGAVLGSAGRRASLTLEMDSFDQIGCESRRVQAVFLLPW